MQNLISNANSEHLNTEKMNSHHQFLLTLISENESIKSQYVDTSNNLSAALASSSYESLKYLDIITAKDTFIHETKAKLLHYKQELDRITQERDETASLLQLTRRDLEILNKEYDEIRRRISNVKSSSLETVCIHCKKLYQEAENMNWSCKTHMSQYSSNMWWCCGKSDSDAEGCKIGFHISKEEGEEQGVKCFSKLLCTVISI